MRKQYCGLASVCLMVVAGVAFLAPTKSFAQVPGSAVVTVTRIQIVPNTQPVGTNYTVVLEVHTREAGVVQAWLQVPPMDRVVVNPPTKFIAAGQREVFSFTVYCGEPGGIVRGFADVKR